MKKLTNKPGAVVDEMLDGMVTAHPELRRLDSTNILVHDDTPAEGKVAVVSGGGSGYEPAHAGYLGEGMLDGAATGEVFTSPTTNQLDEIIQAADADEGVLCVVKNCEGDVISFDTTAEMAGMEGVDAEQVVINDDVTVEDSLYTSGCHNVAGTIFIRKCADAEAAVGGDLGEVTAVAEKVVNNMRTMGMALISCVTPKKDEPTFDLGEGEIELGVGIHGKPDAERADVMSADKVTGHLTENVLDDLDLGESGEVVTMVNGMGDTPLSELYIVSHKLQSTLDDRGVETWGAWVGDYVTSFGMVDCSVSMLRVDDELKELPGAPTETPGLTATE